MENSDVPLRLTWNGAKHEVLFGLQAERVFGKLYLRKQGGSQGIDFQMPYGVTIEDIRTAWQLQNQHWRELFVYKDGPFVAVRAIVLADGLCILWHVFHVADAPYDAVCVMKLPGAAEMGTIIAYKAD